jgi:DNA-binding CsgD family transcriptional regulator
MSHSQHVRFRDLREAFRIIGECVELGDDVMAWRGHLIERAVRLVGGRVGMSGEGRWVGTPRALEPTGAVDSGWDSAAERGFWLRYMVEHGPANDPIHQKVSELHGRLVTRTREQLLGDGEWYRSFQFNDFHKASRLDHFINSYCQLATPDEVTVLGIFRELGDPNFQARDRRLIHLLHHELGPMVGHRLSRCAAPAAPKLSPRASQTLERLLAGDSEKEAAANLGISQATVHQYVTAVYRQLNVNSRAELLALYLRNGHVSKRGGPIASLKPVQRLRVGRGRS